MSAAAAKHCPSCFTRSPSVAPQVIKVTENRTELTMKAWCGMRRPCHIRESGRLPIASARRQLDFRPADDDEREFVGHQQIAGESVDVVASDRRDQLVVAVEIIDPEILQLDRDEQTGEPAAA